MTEALQQEIRTLRSLLDSERDPGGRVFAPLADAYRRAGRLPEALRLLNEGLAKHPDFVTGHVVAAQLYVEQGLGAEGQLAARRALALDGENVVALGALLQVLEESGAAEAGDVRDRLTALEPGFVLKAKPTPEAPPDVVRKPREEPASPEPQTVPVRALDRATPTAKPVPETFEIQPTRREPVIPADAIDLSMLAPLPAAALPLSALAPEIAPVDMGSDFELPTLVPDKDEPADEEPVMDLALLAPEPADEEPVMDLALLAPEPADEEPVIDRAALASPAPELLGFDEPVFDLDALAPSMRDEEGTTAAEAVTPAPPAEEAVDVASLSADRPDEIVIDLDALRPEGAPTEPPPPEAEAAAPLVAPPSTPQATAEASDPPPEVAEREDDAPPAAQGDEEGEPVYTRTLAELYASQGATRQAIEVLRRILAENPGDQEVSRRVEELEAGASVAPVEEEEEVETLARDLAESGATRHDVESPFAWAERESEATEVKGPTIREYFDGLLGWEPREDA